MNHKIIKKIRRGLSLFLLSGGGIIIVFVAKQAFVIKEWNTIAASLAVVTALITVYISLKSTWKTEDEQEPELILKWDFESSVIVNLEIENIGGGSAYDVAIEWSKALKHATNKPISFGVIPCLPKNQKLKTIVTSQPEIWKNAKEYGESNDSFSGIIKFKRRKNSRRFEKQDFVLSLGFKRFRIDYETTEQEYYSQGKKIVSELTDINENLSRIIEESMKNK
ncbi:hypothetical protein GM418_13855 [Maribellus comscasis]|uniref:Uncharacterized protein n=1 Tax=Maribellus comscasis TaxID=2681766 RepID=A0A6I6JQL0_9BACT|nr:hypothetical protein [Maribellus comscasis]QGY44711.1 hypothetical protein GM418_13855 [Maribellus comscasis]